MEDFGISKEEANYFVFSGEVSNNAYNHEKQVIKVLKKNGKVVDLTKETEAIGVGAISKTITKHYLCYPK